MQIVSRPGFKLRTSVFQFGDSRRPFHYPSKTTETGDLQSALSGNPKCDSRRFLGRSLIVLAENAGALVSQKWGPSKRNPDQLLVLALLHDLLKNIRQICMLYVLIYTFMLCSFILLFCYLSFLVNKQVYLNMAIKYRSGVLCSAYYLIKCHHFP